MGQPASQTGQDSVYWTKHSTPPLAEQPQRVNSGAAGSSLESSWYYAFVVCLRGNFLFCRLSRPFGDSNISGPSDHGLFESQDTNAACTGDAQGSAEDRPWPRTKWGRCPLCEYSLRPHLYQSGPYRGSFRLLCSQIWILEDGRRQCWNSIPVPALMWSKLPRFLRQKYHELPASLLRNAQGP